MSASESERINTISLNNGNRNSNCLRSSSDNFHSMRPPPTKLQQDQTAVSVLLRPSFAKLQSCEPIISSTTHTVTGSGSLRKKTKWRMPCSRQSGANFSGLIDRQTNFTNATSQFNAVYSVFNIKLMKFTS